jgi:hypothetical protein
MKRMLLISAAALLLATGPALHAQSAPPAPAALTDEENKLLALALEKNFAGNGYTVVDPATNPRRLGLDSAEARERIRKSLREKPALAGYALDELLDRFYERNARPIKLTLASNAGNGYVFDDDGKFAAYFASGAGGDGWKKLRKENPLAHGMTGVSVPVFDPKTGLLIVYMGTQYDWLAGGGYLIVYKYEKEKLVELARIMLWIS